MTTGENQMNRWVMQRLRTLSVIPLTFLLASWAAAQERSIDLPDLSPPPASQGFAPAPGLTLDKATAILAGRVPPVKAALAFFFKICVASLQALVSDPGKIWFGVWRGLGSTRNDKLLHLYFRT